MKPPAPAYLGPGKHSGAGNKPIKRIVMHGTVSPCVPGGARNIARYFRSEGAGGSAHYVVDPVETVQVVYDSYVAWHAPPNGNSLGVEICDPVAGPKGPLPLNRWNSGGHAKALQNAAELVAHLCLAYDVPMRMVGAWGLKRGRQGICEHDDVSKAFGQSSHWDLGLFPRRKFARMVRAAAQELQQEASKTVARNDRRKPRRPSRVDKARDLLNAALRKPRIQRIRKKRLKAGLAALPKH